MHSAEIAVFVNRVEPNDKIIQIRRGYTENSASCKETKNFMKISAAADYYAWVAVAERTERRRNAGCRHDQLYKGQREYQEKMKRRVLKIFKNI